MNVNIQTPSDKHNENTPSTPLLEWVTPKLESLDVKGTLTGAIPLGIELFDRNHIPRSHS